MNKINGYWIDENSNGWDANIYTEEQAKEYSDTLVNCRYCQHCYNCHDCRHCRNCSNCEYCNDCRYCHNCRDCHDCRRCQNCDHCRDCEHCRNCCDCQDCHDCQDYIQNPQRYVTPKIGSRNDSTKVYWTNENDIQVICGCFRGDLEDWEEAINETHKDNEKHRNDYLKQLEIIRTLIKSN